MKPSRSDVKGHTRSGHYKTIKTKSGTKRVSVKLSTVTSHSRKRK